MLHQRRYNMKDRLKNRDRMCVRVCVRVRVCVCVCVLQRDRGTQKVRENTERVKIKMTRKNIKDNIK